MCTIHKIFINHELELYINTNYNRLAVLKICLSYTHLVKFGFSGTYKKKVSEYLQN